MAFTKAEMHSLENLRGIPKALNSDLHLSKIRLEWNRFYEGNLNPAKQELLNKATEIDINTERVISILNQTDKIEEKNNGERN